MMGMMSTWDRVLSRLFGIVRITNTLLWRIGLLATSYRRRRRIVDRCAIRRLWRTLVLRFSWVWCWLVL